MRRLIFAVLFFITACGNIDYENAPAGRFTGSLVVLWVEENETDAGDGLFVYLPVPGDELTFERNNPDATVTKITPSVMYTDGGSVPRAAQAFKGFSPWGYAPAYMVHDWIFLARKCVRDGMATPEEQIVQNMKFIESAEVLAEAIKTLVRENKVSRNDVAGSAISSAVAGPISRKQWNEEGACESHRLKPEHQKKVNDYLNRFSMVRKASLVLKEQEESPVRVVSVIRF